MNPSNSADSHARSGSEHEARGVLSAWLKMTGQTMVVDGGSAMI